MVPPHGSTPSAPPLLAAAVFTSRSAPHLGVGSCFSSPLVPPTRIDEGSPRLRVAG